MSGSANGKPHKRLLAWQRAMDLYVAVHRETVRFPAVERYLVSQMRRAALSAPSNIAEGAADQTPEQFRLFLGYALRSLSELDTQLEASRRVGLIDEARAAHLCALVDEASRLTYGLRRRV